MWGAQVSMVSTPAPPRALLAELLLSFPISLHAFCISTPASPFTELMNNGRPVIRLTSEPSLSLIVSSQSQGLVAPPSPGTTAFHRTPLLVALFYVK